MLRVSCRAGLGGKHTVALDKLTDHEMIIASQLVIPDEINVSIIDIYLVRQSWWGLWWADDLHEEAFPGFPSW